MMAEDILALLSDQARLTMETVRRDIIRQGTNVVFPNGLTSRTAVKNADQDITVEAIKLAVLKIKNQGGKTLRSITSGSTVIGSTPIRAAYIGVCSHFTTETLRELPGFISVEKYAIGGKGVIDEREIGSIAGVRFVESENDEGINFGGKVLEQTIILGADAYATTTLRGKSAIKSIVKEIGSAGADDPLDQYGTIGWKAIGGAKIINENWMCRIEHIAESNFGVNNQKHYMDYSN